MKFVRSPCKDPPGGEKCVALAAPGETLDARAQSVLAEVEVSSATDVVKCKFAWREATEADTEECAELNRRSASNALVHTSTFGPFSAVSTPISATKCSAFFVI